MATFDDQLTAIQNAVVGLNNLTQTLKTVLPVVQSTATTATAGSGTLPAKPKGFLNITLPDGTAAKVPYYDP